MTGYGTVGAKCSRSEAVEKRCEKHVVVVVEKNEERVVISVRAAVGVHLLLDTLPRFRGLFWCSLPARPGLENLIHFFVQSINRNVTQFDTPRTSDVSFFFGNNPETNVIRRKILRIFSFFFC